MSKIHVIYILFCSVLFQISKLRKLEESSSRVTDVLDIVVV